ncbi:hypothetical protein [Paludisphaera sp.]|uniref:hypothetical protein n=1 Tax=Paludisphaera sp. TaxID=2017432 RepID=UPI00301C292C
MTAATTENHCAFGPKSIRPALWLLTLLLGSGCGRPDEAAPDATSEARTALERGLDEWRSGKEMKPGVDGVLTVGHAFSNLLDYKVAAFEADPATPGSYLATVNLKLETSAKVPTQGGGPAVETQIRYRVAPKSQGGPGAWWIGELVK